MTANFVEVIGDLEPFSGRGFYRMEDVLLFESWETNIGDLEPLIVNFWPLVFQRQNRSLARLQLFHKVVEEMMAVIRTEAEHQIYWRAISIQEPVEFLEHFVGRITQFRLSAAVKELTQTGLAGFGGPRGGDELGDVFDRD